MDRPYIFSRDDAQIKEFSLYIFRFSWTAVRRNGWLGIVNGYRYRGMNLRREPVASYISIHMQVAWGDTAKPDHSGRPTIPAANCMRWPVHCTCVWCTCILATSSQRQATRRPGWMGSWDVHAWHDAVVRPIHDEWYGWNLGRVYTSHPH